jgi:radical SAM-linked protein
MRLFQRAFQRARLPLKHSQGFNPRPYVSVVLPLSVGVESCCELLDFDLDGSEVPLDQIPAMLNEVLVEGVRVLDCYEEGMKIKHLAYLDCRVLLEYDAGVTEDTENAVRELFTRSSLNVTKKSKNGPVEQDIIPMVRRISVARKDGHTLVLDARVCCQNPALNPMQLALAVETYLPEHRPDFAKSCRLALYDSQEKDYR